MLSFHTELHAAADSETCITDVPNVSKLQDIHESIFRFQEERVYAMANGHTSTRWIIQHSALANDPAPNYVTWQVKALLCSHGTLTIFQ